MKSAATCRGRCAVSSATDDVVAGVVEVQYVRHAARTRRLTMATRKQRAAHGGGSRVARAEGTGSPSAALPSPFPPIAEYAFLSNCHTGALVAPDGGVGWLCVPRFDSASVFGSLLDREAGMFRFGPFGINVPTSRAYEPGTNVVVTTWRTPSGWVVVRDALDDGPITWERHRDTSYAAAGRRRRRAHLGACRGVPRRSRRDRGGVRAGVRLRAGAGHVADRGRGRPCRRGEGRRRRRSGCRPTCRSAWRAAG